MRLGRKLKKIDGLRQALNVVGKGNRQLMRIQHRYLTWDGNTKVIKPVKALLDKFSIEYSYSEDPECVIPSYRHKLEFFLDEDDPRFVEIKSSVDKFKMLAQVGTIFDKEDFEKANWFHINAGEYQYPQPEEDFGYLQTTYNLDNYCPTCGIGKIQNAPFYLKQVPKQKNSQFWGLHWVFDVVFVRPETKEVLIREGITGISFLNPRLYKKDLVIEEVSQIMIQSSLPPGLMPYNLKDVTCKYMNEEDVNLSEKWQNPKEATFCSRHKFNFPMRGGLTFNEKIFDNAPDFVQSYEWFGSGASAIRPIIVSKRFKQVIENNKIRGLKFTPIFHEEADIIRQTFIEPSESKKSWKSIFKI